MAHELFIDIRGKASMAYVEDKPWHGLGQQLTRGAPLETWAKEAGMDYMILEAPVTYKNPAIGKHAIYPNRNALCRSDTGAPLGIVGSKYRVVQPLEVLEFFRDLTEQGGFELETAGVLFGGSKYWALARTGETARIGGKGSKDVIDGYLLLATACDGTLQTTAQFTSVRVVCNNTLTAATRGMGRKDNNAIKVSHRSEFKPAEVKEQLGIAGHWAEFVEGAQELAAAPVSDGQALAFIVDVLGDPGKPLQEQAERAKDVATAYQLFKGKGRGSDLKSAKGTAWGLVNSVTEFVDHLSGKSQDQRLRLAWFYDGAYAKNYAFQKAMNDFAYAKAA